MKGWGDSRDSQAFAVGEVVSIEQPLKQWSAEVAAEPSSGIITESYGFKAFLHALGWTSAQVAKHESESDGCLVTFTWLGSAQKIDHKDWSEAALPMAVLHMEPNNTETRHEGWCWEGLRRYGRPYNRSSQKAEHCDNYRNLVPAEAWKLMPQQTIVLQLTSMEESAGHVRLQMSTMGGDEFDIQLPEDSVVKVLMQSVAEQRLLDACCHVSILNDGELLEPLCVLRSLELSKLQESPCPQSQRESAMPETMEISDKAQSGGSSNEHVDTKVDIKLQ
eukprot:CAMPEP_0197633786 /NCGR_PEP_ID=MMETSP1338-20131121/10072_1 /TAXON_ID=43686 ORGANISM="Pelagodinium beii, Strain RCC1491" /NCGR_SAMPLE_ID=MMETSP1338 /ASSEMBLY_ACC=CAM_ASM_000754 /LENGTH=276 /DNA_ID=CAMNT_0043205527 /DNA_START=216 /DNA_END=1046 /DNA_ORIENTATION=-